MIITVNKLLSVTVEQCKKKFNSILSPESIVRLHLNTYFGQLVGQMNKLLPGEYDTQKWVPSVAETQGKPKCLFKKHIH